MIKFSRVSLRKNGLLRLGDIPLENENSKRSKIINRLLLNASNFGNSNPHNNTKITVGSLPCIENWGNTIRLQKMW